MSSPADTLTSVPDSGRSSDDRNSWLSGVNLALRWLLFLIAAWYFLWPVYRAFLNIEIDTNEGWNAYLADAAYGRTPLYPSPEKLVTNNYPPLSYYIVGGFGKLVGDPILAGRLISLVAVLGIGVAIAAAIRFLGGDRAGAGVGGVIFVITITHFSHHYVGMDDPQLLAQAIMAAGFAAFLRAEGNGRSCLGPILLMGLAGFVKHNIIAMPLTAFFWLGFSRPREAFRCALIAGMATALGFGLCFLFYGRDFFSNMLIARQTAWSRSWHYAGDLRCVNVELAVTVLLGLLCWRDRGARVCLLLTLVGLGTAILQRAGMGVDKNAIFDLMIGVSMGMGLAFSYARQMPAWGALSGRMIQLAILLALCVRVYPMGSHPERTYRLLFDSSFKQEIAIRERVTAAAIAQVKSTPGPVMSSTFVCYRSGKPFVVDKFNVTQRMATGALPKQTLRALLQSGQLTEVRPDVLTDWDNPLNANSGL